MRDTRAKLEQRLSALPGLTISKWKDTDLVCLFFEGKEFAHFHGSNILDIRLSQKIIRNEQLSRDISSQIHPKRSKNSRWIGVEFTDDDDIAKIVSLVKQACSELG